MAYGTAKQYTDTIASGASTSAGINIGGKIAEKIVVQVGTMSTAAAIAVQQSVDGGSTWYNVYHMTIQSSSVATPQVFIASGVGTNGGVSPLPWVGLFGSVRFLATAVVSGGVAFKVICSD